MSFDFNGEFLSKPVPESNGQPSVERICELLAKMDNHMNSITAMILQCDDKDEITSLACSLMASAKHILKNNLSKEQYDNVIRDILRGFI